MLVVCSPMTSQQQVVGHEAAGADAGTSGISSSRSGYSRLHPEIFTLAVCSVTPKQVHLVTSTR